MKKIVIPVVGLLGIIVIIMVWVTSGPSKSPSEVVTAFYELANEGNFSQAKDYMSSDLIKMAENSGKNISMVMAKGTHNGAIKDIEITSKNINGELAIVQVKENWKDGTPSKNAKYYLIKENGEWKLTIK